MTIFLFFARPANLVPRNSELGGLRFLKDPDLVVRMASVATVDSRYSTVLRTAVGRIPVSAPVDASVDSEGALQLINEFVELSPEDPPLPIAANLPLRLQCTS